MCACISRVGDTSVRVLVVVLRCCCRVCYLSSFFIAATLTFMFLVNNTPPDDSDVLDFGRGLDSFSAAVISAFVFVFSGDNYTGSRTRAAGG